MESFIVTSGEYSAYGIDAVFSSLAKAQAFIDKHDNPLAFSIEVYQVDKEEHVVSQTLYDAFCHLDTGELYVVNEYEHSLLPLNHSKASICDVGGVPRDSRGESVVSKEHAIKLAVEARQKFLRENGFKSESSQPK